jgi:hypothetical protein
MLSRHPKGKVAGTHRGEEVDVGKGTFLSHIYNIISPPHLNIDTSSQGMIQILH